MYQEEIEKPEIHPKASGAVQFWEDQILQKNGCLPIHDLEESLRFMTVCLNTGVDAGIFAKVIEKLVAKGSIIRGLKAITWLFNQELDLVIQENKHQEEEIMKEQKLNRSCASCSNSGYLYFEGSRDGKNIVTIVGNCEECSPDRKNGMPTVSLDQLRKGKDGHYYSQKAVDIILKRKENAYETQRV